jgi:hypothetical protein
MLIKAALVLDQIDQDVGAQPDNHNGSLSCSSNFCTCYCSRVATQSASKPARICSSASPRTFGAGMNQQIGLIATIQRMR